MFTRRLDIVTDRLFIENQAHVHLGETGAFYHFSLTYDSRKSVITGQSYGSIVREPLVRFSIFPHWSLHASSWINLQPVFGISWGIAWDV